MSPNTNIVSGILDLTTKSSFTAANYVSSYGFKWVQKITN